MKYIHYDCLKNWLNSKIESELGNINIEKEQPTITYSTRDICCELCKTKLPDYLKHNNQYYNITFYRPKFEKFLVLESIRDDSRRTKFIHIIPFTKKYQIKIGRNNQCDLSLPDLSVSRIHCLLFCENDKLILENNSKFGTLVSIQSPKLLMSEDYPLRLEIKNTYLRFVLKKKTSFFSCCNVKTTTSNMLYAYQKQNEKHFDIFCSMVFKEEEENEEKENENDNKENDDNDNDNKENNDNKNENDLKEENKNKEENKKENKKENNKNDKNLIDDENIDNRKDEEKFNKQKKELIDNNKEEDQKEEKKNDKKNEKEKINYQSNINLDNNKKMNIHQINLQAINDLDLDFKKDHKKTPVENYSKIIFGLREGEKNPTEILMAPKHNKNVKKNNKFQLNLHYEHTDKNKGEINNKYFSKYIENQGINGKINDNKSQ